jgi:drug/metabolite transporter (DMT)-like permease
MNLLLPGVVLLAALMGSVGQILFKRSSTGGFAKAIRTRDFWLGVVLYGLAAAIFVLALKGGTLVLLYPLISTSYIWTSLLAVRIFGEEMNSLKWIGVLLIVGGTFMTQI